MALPSGPRRGVRAAGATLRGKGRETGGGGLNLVLLAMRRDEVMRGLRNWRAELQRLGVERLYMFGSTARDEAREDSDVDLFFDYPRANSACMN